MRSHKLVRQPANPASHKVRLTKKDCLLRIYLFDAAGCQSRLADLHKPIRRRITAVDYHPLASPLNMFGPMEIYRRLQAKSCLMVVIDCDERLGIQAVPSSGKFHHRDNRCKLLTRLVQLIDLTLLSGSRDATNDLCLQLFQRPQLRRLFSAHPNVSVGVDFANWDSYLPTSSEYGFGLRPALLALSIGALGAGSLGAAFGCFGTPPPALGGSPGNCSWVEEVPPLLVPDALPGVAGGGGDTVSGATGGGAGTGRC